MDLVRERLQHNKQIENWESTAYRPSLPGLDAPSNMLSIATTLPHGVSPIYILPTHQAKVSFTPNPFNEVGYYTDKMPLGQALP